MAVLNSTQKRATYFVAGAKYEVRNDTDGTSRVASSNTFGVFVEKDGTWTKLDNQQGKEVLDKISALEGYDGSNDSSFSTYIGRLLTYVEDKYQIGRVVAAKYEDSQSAETEAAYQKQVELAEFQARVLGEKI